MAFCLCVHRQIDQYAIRNGIARGEPLALIAPCSPAAGSMADLAFDLVTDAEARAVAAIHSVFEGWQRAPHAIEPRMVSCLQFGAPVQHIWDASASEAPIELTSPISLETMIKPTVSLLNANAPSSRTDTDIRLLTPLVLDSQGRRARFEHPSPLTLGRLVRACHRRFQALSAPATLEALRVQLAHVEAEADAADKARRAVWNVRLERVTYTSSLHPRPIEMLGWTGEVVWRDASHAAIAVLRAASWSSLGQRTRLGFGRIVTGAAYSSMPNRAAQT